MKAKGELNTVRDIAFAAWPDEEPDLLGAREGLRDIAHFVALVARSQAAAETPEYVEVARPRGQVARRMSGVFLGAVPDYAENGAAGMRSSGVVRGGPAETAGVKGADVLIEPAGRELANIYDFVRTQNGLNPSEEVWVGVLRKGEATDLRVTPVNRN